MPEAELEVLRALAAEAELGMLRTLAAAVQRFRDFHPPLHHQHTCAQRSDLPCNCGKHAMLEALRRWEER